MASAKEIAKLISIIAAATPSFRPGRGAEGQARIREMVQAYHMILGDLDMDRLTGAATHVMAQGTFFPSAGELRQAYFNLEERAAGVPTADEAWAEVKRLFHRGYSRYRPPTSETVSHPRVWKALEGIGGWRTFCNSDNDAADRARFLQAYETHTNRDRELSRMLPGVRQVIEELAGRYRQALGSGNGEPVQN